MTRAVLMLAGGSGSRFEGEDHKLDVDFRGRPLAAHALEVVRSLLGCCVDQVYLVTGAATLDPALEWLAATESVAVDDLGFTIVHNEHWSDGLAASLAVGIDRATIDGHDAVIVGLADQPLIQRDTWRAVAEADGPIVIATYGGRRRPPVKLDRSVWRLLPRSGDEGARSLIRLRPDLVSEIACIGNPIDIDTREDLQRWS